MSTVFVSHRTQDLVSAQALADAMREDGHEVWLDVERIGLGDSIVAAIDRGLADATHLLLCCSGAGHDSPWMSREWMSTLARQLDGHGVRVLPVLLAGGSPPAILADIKYADLSGDFRSGIAEIKAALRGGAGCRS
jgi:molybdopterin-guanine dinucleotide biosynthesis protein A